MSKQTFCQSCADLLNEGRRSCSAWLKRHRMRPLYKGESDMTWLTDSESEETQRRRGHPKFDSMTPKGVTSKKREQMVEHY